MTQLIVSVDDVATLRDVKKAISLLRGVTAVKVSRKSEDRPNAATLKAMQEAESGDTIKCSGMDEYLRLVRTGSHSDLF